MKITFRHPCSLPVALYGGTERIIFWLMKSLVELGHEITFIGHGSQKLKDFGIHFLDETSVSDWRSLIPRDTDIVHLQYNTHEEIDFPLVLTMHGNAKIEEKFPRNTVFLTQKHALNHRADCWVYNPIDFSEYPEKYFNQKNQLSRFLFLAKATWSVKNLKQSLKCTKALKKELHIIGGKLLFPRGYATAHGFLGGDEKLQIMSQCDALLAPVRWEEPFGIALVEAMALGMPIFGSNYGSLAEIVQEGQGRTFSSYKELVKGIKSDEFNYDSRFIRESVIKRFNAYEQAQKYVSCYERVVAGESLNQKLPERDLKLNPTGLLDF